MLPALALYLYVVLVPSIRVAGYAFTDWSGLGERMSFVGLENTIGAASPTLSVAFWQAMRAAGYQASELGTSFYPTSNDHGDRLALFKDVTTTLSGTFGKPVFVAELGYPSSAMSAPYAWNSALPGYPISPQGEHDFVRDVVAWGAGDGPLSGVRPWAPDYCVGGWQPMSHFASSGVAEPVIDAIAEGLLLA